MRRQALWLVLVGLVAGALGFGAFTGVAVTIARFGFVLLIVLLLVWLFHKRTPPR